MLTREINSAYLRKPIKRHIVQLSMIISQNVDFSRRRLAAILDLNIPEHQNDGLIACLKSTVNSHGHIEKTSYPNHTFPLQA